MLRVDLPVHLGQEDVLVPRLLVAVVLRADRGEPRLGVGIRGQVPGEGEDDVVGDVAPLAVVGGEEERLVLDDGTAERGSELVDVVGRPGPDGTGGLVRVAVRVQVLVPVELEHRPVEVVRARLGHDVHDGASRASVLRGVGVPVHLELLDRVLAELVGGAAGAGAPEALAEEGVVIVRAVDHDAVERPALAREADVAGTGVARDPRGGEHEVDEVPAVDGKVADRPLVHRGRLLRAVALDERGLRLHRDRLLRPRDLEGEVDFDDLADVELDVAALQDGKALEGRRDLVEADGQERGAEEAERVGLGVAHDARLLVPDRHGHPGKQSTGLVGDRPLYGTSRVGLGERGGGGQREQRAQAQDEGKGFQETRHRILPSNRLTRCGARRLGRWGWPVTFM